MKKFIAPTVRVIKYESNIICESPNVSIDQEGRNPGTGGANPGDDYEYAPSRRIFE